jgi:Flp pilus assembly protein TadD
MPSQEIRNFTLPLDSFDTSLLGERVDRNSPDFTEAVHRYFTQQFEQYGGWANISVDPQQIRISWRPDSGRPDIIDLVISQLEQGQYPSAIQMMELLLQTDPDDESLLYNLGMALSDVGRLSEAERHLRKLLAIDPNNTNGRIALGVALQRQQRNKDAIAELRRAVREDTRNPWAHRNLGACLLQAGEATEGKEHLKTATELNPTDQQAWFGLGKAYRELGDDEKADEVFIRVIDLGEYSNVAEAARQERSALGHKSFRAKVGSAPRPDAVMYLLGAMQKFETMSREQTQAVTFEIVMLGQRGLDVNDPAQKYQLRSMPGHYSGLHLVCLMNVGFKMIAPEHDIGFDLSKEYEAAKMLHQSNGGKKE